MNTMSGIMTVLKSRAVLAGNWRLARMDIEDQKAQERAKFPCYRCSLTNACEMLADLRVHKLRPAGLRGAGMRLAQPMLATQADSDLRN